MAMRIEKPNLSYGRLMDFRSTTIDWRVYHVVSQMTNRIGDEPFTVRAWDYGLNPTAADVSSLRQALTIRLQEDCWETVKEGRSLGLRLNERVEFGEVVARTLNGVHEFLSGSRGDSWRYFLSRADRDAIKESSAMTEDVKDLRAAYRKTMRQMLERSRLAGERLGTLNFGIRDEGFPYRLLDETVRVFALALRGEFYQGLIPYERITDAKIVEYFHGLPVKRSAEFPRRDTCSVLHRMWERLLSQEAGQRFDPTAGLAEMVIRYKDRILPLAERKREEVVAEAFSYVDSRMMVDRMVWGG